MFMVSIVLGLFASAFPNLLYRKIVFAAVGSTPEQAVKNLFLGVTLKFVSFILLFSALLHIPKIQTEVLFWAFLLAELTRWIGRWLSIPRILLDGRG